MGFWGHKNIRDRLKKDLVSSLRRKLFVSSMLIFGKVVIIYKTILRNCHKLCRIMHSSFRDILNVMTRNVSGSTKMVFLTHLEMLQHL